MAYKMCREFIEPLKSGDKLEFKLGDESAGAFSVAELPNSDAVLLLVIHRHDTLRAGVSFESHVFADLQNPQVAIIDTYKGKAGAHARILDAKLANQSRSEELRYGSVIAVNPGVYEVELSGQDGETKARHELVALSHQSYVVLRTGLEAQAGVSFPQELVVFPASNQDLLKSYASGITASLTLVTLATSITMSLHGK